MRYYQKKELRLRLRDSFYDTKTRFNSYFLEESSQLKEVKYNELLKRVRCEALYKLNLNNDEEKSRSLDKLTNYDTLRRYYKYYLY